MHEITFSLALECNLNTNSYQFSRSLLKENLVGYNIEKSGFGYLISSPFLILSDLKSKTKTLLKILRNYGEIDTSKVSYFKVSNPLLSDGTSLLLNLDTSFFLDLYPSLKERIDLSLKKIIKPSDISLVKIDKNFNINNFFNPKSFPSSFYSMDNKPVKDFSFTKTFQPKISLKLIGKEFKVEDITTIGSYLNKLILKVYKEENNGSSLASILDRYNKLSQNFYSYRLFKDKYKKVTFSYNYNFDVDTLRKSWVFVFKRLKYLFWYNDLEDTSFNLNWNSSTNRLELNKLQKDNLYLKETDLYQCKIKDSIIINSTLKNVILENCYIINSYLLSSSTTSSFLDNCFWTDDSIHNKTIIKSQKKEKKNIAYDANVDIVKNY